MGLVEGVSCEGLDQFEHRIGQLFGIAFSACAAHEFFAFGCHDLRVFLAHRFPENVRLA